MKNFKKVISAVIALAVSATTFVSAASFTDVAKTASYAEAIDVLSSLGIVAGFDDGTFKPEDNITRAQAATMVVEALNMGADADNAAGTTQFADVNETAAWASGYINVGVAQKFISGMGDGTFAPQANVTYAQMCVMLTSIAGYGDYAAAGGYPTGYTNMAATTGINKGVSVGDNTALTRGQVAQMIYNTLTTPMLGISAYRLGDNEYEMLDGSEGKFKTLLSDKFDAYVATVTIDATPVSSNLENGKVTVTYKKADWWYSAEKGDRLGDANKEDKTILVAEGVDVNSNLLEQGKAIFALNEEEEITMVYFASNGKTDAVELDAEEYVPQSKLNADSKYSDANKIRFGSKYYKLNPAGVKVYVNGYGEDGIKIEATDAATAMVNLDKYIGKAVGTVKLVDNDDAEGYEVIMVDNWNVAKVSSVEYKNGATTIEMVNKVFAGKDYSEIVIEDEDVEEGKIVVNVTKNGEAADIASIAKGDIIAYKAQINATLTSASIRAIDIMATNDVISGKVTSEDPDENTYIIDGTPYKFTNRSFGSLKVGSPYKLTLDPFGNIYTSDDDASAILYAIALGADEDDSTIKLLLADGTTKTYEVDDKSFTMDKFASTSVDKAFAEYLESADPKDRVVTYKVKNSNGKITAIAKQNVADSDWGTTGTAVYKAKSNKLGNVLLNEDVIIIDARVAVKDSKKSAVAGGYALFDINNLKNDGKYGYAAYKTDNKETAFVILSAVGTPINEDSRFAVVRKAPATIETEEGDEVDSVIVLADGEAEKELYFNSKVYTNHDLAVGDAFFYVLDGYGMVEDVFKVLDADFKNKKYTFTSLYDALDTSLKSYISTVETEDYSWGFELLSKNDIQLVEGYVVSGDNGVTFVEVKSPINEIDTTVEFDGANTGVVDFVASEDTKVYVFDTGSDEIKDYNKFSVKADTTSITSTGIAKYYDEKTKVYSSDTVDMSKLANYAVAMIVNDEVVEIYVIK